MKRITSIAFCFLMMGCQVNLPGTNTGNPEYSAPAIELSGIYRLAYVICAKTDSCYPEADLNSCYTQVTALNGYTSELGATGSTYETVDALSAAETANTVNINTTNFDACEQALTQLTCTDSLVQNAYSIATPTQYSQTKQLFGAAGSCSQIY